MGGAWIKSGVVVYAVLRLSRSFSNTLRRAWHFWLTFRACDRVTFELGFCYIIPGGGGAHVVGAHGSGGFGVVSVQFKVWALHVQWVRCFVTSFSCWMQFLFYYCRKAFRFFARCGSLTPLPLWPIVFASGLSRPSLRMGRCRGFLLGHSGVCLGSAKLIAGGVNCSGQIIFDVSKRFQTR